MYAYIFMYKCMLSAYVYVNVCWYVYVRIYIEYTYPWAWSNKKRHLHEISSDMMGGKCTCTCECMFGILGMCPHTYMHARVHTNTYM